MLRDQIQKDLLEAMKSKDEVKLGALRMLKSAIMKFEVSGQGKKEASDEDVLALIGKEIKSRKDSVQAFRDGNRPDLAVREEAEIAALMPYMPAQMSEDEIRAVITETIAATGVTGAAEKGKLMGALMPKVKGKADGQLVNRIVGELLK